MKQQSENKLFEFAENESNTWNDLSISFFPPPLDSSCIDVCRDTEILVCFHLVSTRDQYYPPLLHAPYLSQFFSSIDLLGGPCIFSPPPTHPPPSLLIFFQVLH